MQNRENAGKNKKTVLIIAIALLLVLALALGGFTSRSAASRSLATYRRATAAIPPELRHGVWKLPPMRKAAHSQAIIIWQAIRGRKKRQMRG